MHIFSLFILLISLFVLILILGIEEINRVWVVREVRSTQ